MGLLEHRLGSIGVNPPGLNYLPFLRYDVTRFDFEAMAGSDKKPLDRNILHFSDQFAIDQGFRFPGRIAHGMLASMVMAESFYRRYGESLSNVDFSYRSPVFPKDSIYVAGQGLGHDVEMAAVTHAEPVLEGKFEVGKPMPRRYLRESDLLNITRLQFARSIYEGVPKAGHFMLRDFDFSKDEVIKFAELFPGITRGAYMLFPLVLISAALGTALPGHGTVYEHQGGKFRGLSTWGKNTVLIGISAAEETKSKYVLNLETNVYREWMPGDILDGPKVVLPAANWFKIPVFEGTAKVRISKSRYESPEPIDVERFIKSAIK